MTEHFALPCVGALIRRMVDGQPCLLFQERRKPGIGVEDGLLELPAGKLRQYENVFEALRREVREETGLILTAIIGEHTIHRREVLGYDVHSFTPYCVTQNLKKNVEDGPGLIHCPPEPMLDPTDLHAHLIQKPPGTPPGFPVAQFLREAWGELDVPLPEGFVADLNTALVEQFLHVTLTQGEAVVQPQRITDDAQGKTVAVGLAVSHS